MHTYILTSHNKSYTHTHTHTHTGLAVTDGGMIALPPHRLQVRTCLCVYMCAGLSRLSMSQSLSVCMCVCIDTHTLSPFYAYTHTHTHTHTQVDLRGLWDLKEEGESISFKVLRDGRTLHLQVCLCVCVCVCVCVSEERREG